jgi:hypothetical protein
MTAAIKKLDAHIWERAAGEFYCEPPWCSGRLFEEETFDGGIYDPCCGFGTIVIEALKRGLTAYGSDLVHRGWDSTRTPHDFLAPSVESHANIVCNPPFDVAPQFAAAALARTERKVAMIFPTPRLNAARWLRATPLMRIWLLTPRPSMPPGTTIVAGQKPGRGKKDFCWLIWQRGHVGAPEISWLHRDKHKQQ